ncbi:hypothetical protein DN730_17415 [Marinomonas piezotolerans]|uniref:Uncharacterized protein n=1 Tax=Marinomonas piezotolerans TaxID=2213058 RepID=A0A370U4Y2_9GAMM|nr:hypothetical protein [Marinomonas piezotolerans]RDL42840.1 hypothetical protein DN730_17415 [Marinomonas piezotolerans]
MKHFLLVFMLCYNYACFADQVIGIDGFYWTIPSYKYEWEVNEPTKTNTYIRYDNNFNHIDIAISEFESSFSKKKENIMNVVLTSMKKSSPNEYYFIIEDFDEISIFSGFEANKFSVYGYQSLEKGDRKLKSKLDVYYYFEGMKNNNVMIAFLSTYDIEEGDRVNLDFIDKVNRAELF